jgi:hypothetical protein
LSVSAVLGPWPCESSRTRSRDLQEPLVAGRRRNVEIAPYARGIRLGETHDLSASSPDHCAPEGALGRAVRWPPGVGGFRLTPIASEVERPGSVDSSPLDARSEAEGAPPPAAGSGPPTRPHRAIVRGLTPIRTSIMVQGWKRESTSKPAFRSSFQSRTLVTLPRVTPSASGAKGWGDHRPARWFVNPSQLGITVGAATERELRNFS